MILRLATGYDEFVAAQLNNTVLAFFGQPLPDSIGLFAVIAVAGALAAVPWLVRRERRRRAARRSSMKRLVFRDAA